MTADLRHLDVNGTRLACRFREGRSPALMFLPGYGSDMEGSKALALDAFAEARGLAMLRFDYSGTGSSDGKFEDGTLDRWLGEALHLLDTLVDGPVIVIGSSMGGWIALHVAIRRPDKISALVGIAAAADFTDWGFGDDARALLDRDGRLDLPGPDGNSVLTAEFWQSGQSLRLLTGPIAVDCPVRLIHGEKDREVPVKVALQTLDRLRSADVQLTIVKGGGHRLSEPGEIDLILRTVADLVETAQ